MLASNLIYVVLLSSSLRRGFGNIVESMCSPYLFWKLASCPFKNKNKKEYDKVSYFCRSCGNKTPSLTAYLYSPTDTIESRCL